LPHRERTAVLCGAFEFLDPTKARLSILKLVLDSYFSIKAGHLRVLGGIRIKGFIAQLHGVNSASKFDLVSIGVLAPYSGCMFFVAII